MSEQRDTEAFLTLYHQLVPKVYGYLVLRLGHRQTAEDLTSQVWLKAWHAWPTIKKEHAQSWIFRIAHNALVDHLRAMPEVAWDNLDNIVDHAQSPTTASLSEVRQVLNRLSNEQRDIIIMRIWDGLTFSDIAAMLNLSEAACKMRYQRGVTALGSLLSLITLFLYVRH